jgi:nucleotide-binding universal stress UspA family protein
METIVVGIDGSEGADEALRWALGEARLRGAKVRVVVAWHVPAIVYGGVGSVVLTSPAQDFRKGAEATARNALVRLGRASEGLEIETRVREGRPASVLIEEARDAELLVLGSRGHGGFTGLLLGSVSAECAAHSPATVTIVHARSQAA